MTMEKDRYIAQGRTASLYTWGDTRAVKLFSPEFQADAIKEHFAIGIAYDAGLPVPSVHGIVDVDGQQGIVMEHIRGSLLGNVIMFQPWKIRKFSREMAELHAEVHSHTTRELPSLNDKLEYLIRMRSDIPDDIREPVLKILSTLPSCDAICHGDFHTQNIIMTKDSPVIIDWVDATMGNPIADVARTWLLLEIAQFNFDKNIRWIIRVLGNLIWRVYFKRYRELRDVSSQQLYMWQIPVMTARLAEGIQEEREALLSLIEKRLKQQP